MVGQLLKESGVGSNGPRLSYGLEGLCGGHALLHHEVGRNYGGGSGPAHHTIDDCKNEKLELNIKWGRPNIKKSPGKNS